MFSENVDEAHEHFPQIDGNHSLDALFQLCSNFTIVGRYPEGKYPDCSFVDISRTGIIKNTSEFVYFLMHKSGVNLGHLQGTTKAKAKSKPKTGKRAEQKQEAFHAIFGRQCGDAPRMPDGFEDMGAIAEFVAEGMEPTLALEDAADLGAEALGSVSKGEHAADLGGGGSWSLWTCLLMMDNACQWDAS